MKTIYENKNALLRHMKILIFSGIFTLTVSDIICGQKLKLNDLDYFEIPGVNILVFSNQYTGMFNDEKNAGIELIHHGVRTVTGGAVKLQNTPEQWDLVPTVINRKVDKETKTIDVTLRYKDYDFDSRISVTSRDNGVLISVFLDKPLPEKLEGKAGLNMEFIPSVYFRKTYIVDGEPDIFPLYPSGASKTESANSKVFNMLAIQLLMTGAETNI